MKTEETLEHQWKAKRILNNALMQKRISHAYLFEGPSGTGKLACALAFAKAIFVSSLMKARHAINVHNAASLRMAINRICELLRLKASPLK